MTFLKEQFYSKNEDRSIVIHETSATDTTQVQKVIDTVEESVMDRNLLIG